MSDVDGTWYRDA